MPITSPMGRRWMRRVLIVIVVLVTLVALFYAEEDWRGKRAWEKYKHALEAKGEVLDWAAYIPPPVPDDQNIFKAPRMTEWFVGRGHNDLSKRLSGSQTNVTPPAGLVKELLVAEITVVPPDASVSPDGAILRLEDAGDREQAGNRIRDAIGPILVGSYNPSALIFTVKPPGQIKPVHFYLKTGAPPSAAELNRFFTNYPAPPGRGFFASPGGLRFESTEKGSYRVWLTAGQFDYCGAADYVAWSDQFEPDFNLIREAFKRPYARIEGGYTQAYAIPIPNFVTIRYVAQTLSQRALCQLMVGRPDQAMREMTLLHGLSRFLEAEPSGKPMTLVAAMITVSITGTYVQTVAEGFRLQGWREPQIAELQQQLARINLFPFVTQSLQSEQAAALNTLETASATALADQMRSFSGAPRSRWAWIENPMTRFIGLAPRGWLYQNMITSCEMRKAWIENSGKAGPEGQQVFPRKLDSAAASTLATLESRLRASSPYYYLTASMVPNMTAAVRTTAYQQTRVNEALIACALERYRLANGHYPETLTELMPQYLEKIPHDLIGGQPLKYRLKDNGGFILYSVGWNETDDGGVTTQATDSISQADMQHGDWVWPQFQPTK